MSLPFPLAVQNWHRCGRTTFWATSFKFLEKSCLLICSNDIKTISCQVYSILFRYLCLPRLRQNLSTSDLSFAEVTEVEKRELKENFLKLRPQAEAEKCSWSSLFPTEVTWEKLKSDVEEFWFRLWHGKIIKTERFFHFFNVFCKFFKE